MMTRHINSKNLMRLAILSAVILSFGLEAVYGVPKPVKKKRPPKKSPQIYGVVWKRVRPKRRVVRRRSRVSAVAGVRGAKKEKGLQPYWKGGKKDTPDMLEFSRIAGLVEGGKHAEAAKAFKEWLKLYPKSKLAPRVKLSLAVTYAQLGRKNDAVKLLRQWLKDYKGDKNESLARQLLSTLTQKR